MFRKSYKGSITSASSVRHQHKDTKGVIRVRSVNGFRYFVAVVHEFARYLHTCPIKAKGEASDVVLQFGRWFQRQTGTAIRSIHRDNGLGLLRAQAELKSGGLDINLTTAYTS